MLEYAESEPGDYEWLAHEFEAELETYFHDYLWQLYYKGIISQKELGEVYSGVRDEWVRLWHLAQELKSKPVHLTEAGRRRLELEAERLRRELERLSAEYHEVVQRLSRRDYE